MPTRSIVREIQINPSFRVSQMAGIFDLPLAEKSRFEMTVNLPVENRDWKIGLVVGPSGCGKSTVARELYGDALISGFDWPSDRSILDPFPEALSVKEIVKMLNAVGLSSPPTWVRPFRCLSNGEQFRVTLARALMQEAPVIAFDEFTSVVDRDVAKVASACIAKVIRREVTGKQFVAVSCHYDIIEWLNPDWIFYPATNEFIWRELRRRPEIQLHIVRADRAAWKIFARHHYLSTEISSASKCFVATWNNKPVAFFSMIYFPHATLHRCYRGHRQVCLPDYQGLGIGMKLENTIASMLKTLNFTYHAPTSHPAKIGALRKSPDWKMIRKPSINATASNGIWRPDRLRAQATFQYIGKSFPDATLAKNLLACST